MTEKFFVAKFFTYKKNDMVQITVPSLKSWFLVVKLKMGVWQFCLQGTVTKVLKVTLQKLKTSSKIVFIAKSYAFH